MSRGRRRRNRKKGGSVIFGWTFHPQEPAIKMLKDRWCPRCQDEKPAETFKGWCYDCRKEMIISYLMYRTIRWYANIKNYPDDMNDKNVFLMTLKAKKTLALYNK